MSNHIADANKMVIDTPRTTDRVVFIDGNPWVNAPFARDLERELNAANDRIKRLRDGIAKQNQTIEQACGKALGYPWFKDDQKNFLGATEKDGVCVGDHVSETIVSELASRYTEALDRIQRLEEAGDMMALHAQLGGIPLDHIGWVNAWREAKEAKP